MLELEKIMEQLHKQGLNMVVSPGVQSYVIYKGKEQITAPLAIDNLEKNDLAQLYYLEEGFKFKKKIEMQTYIPDDKIGVLKQSLKNKNIFIRIQYICETEDNQFSTTEFKFIPLFELAKLNKQLFIYLSSHISDFKNIDKMNNQDFMKYYGMLKRKYNGDIYENKK